jgi:rsbT co-antagonist protein RsbR
MSETLTEENERLQRELQELRELMQRRESEFAEEKQKLTNSIEQLTQRAESERELFEELMRMQDNLIAELSTPLLPVADRVLVMPIIGSIDQVRAERILTVLLDGVTEQRARTVILDVSGIHRLHSLNANVLVRAARAVRLLGAELIISGITPEHARSLLDLGIDIAELKTCRELRAGIETAVRRPGK